MKDLHLELVLIDETITSTISKLVFQDEFFCFILEDGPRNEKVAGHTRIPEGRYRLIQRKRGRFHEKYRMTFGHSFVVELENVPGFTDILIHVGNSPEDTRGCLLTATSFEYHDTPHQINYRGTNSVAAYKELYNHFAEWFKEFENIYLNINR